MNRAPTPHGGPAATTPPEAIGLARQLLQRRHSPHERRGVSWPKLLSLPEPDLAQVIAWVLDPSLSYATIATKAKTEFGITVSIQSLCRFTGNHVTPLLADVNGEPMQILWASEHYEILLRHKPKAA